MKTPSTKGLPTINRSMRLEWRVTAIMPRRSDELTNTRSHSQCLVTADGTEIATVARDSIPAVRRLMR